MAHPWWPCHASLPYGPHGNPPYLYTSCLLKHTLSSRSIQGKCSLRMLIPSLIASSDESPFHRTMTSSRTCPYGLACTPPTLQALGEPCLLHPSWASLELSSSGPPLLFTTMRYGRLGEYVCPRVRTKVLGAELPHIFLCNRLMLLRKTLQINPILRLQFIHRPPLIILLLYLILGVG